MRTGDARGSVHRMRRVLSAFILASLPLAASAQTAEPSDPPHVALGGVGFGTTWDDEGLVGRGFGLSAGVGLYALLQTGNDLFPHLVIQPIAALAVRF